jgi:hypothetical protein
MSPHARFDSPHNNDERTKLNSDTAKTLVYRLRCTPLSAPPKRTYVVSIGCSCWGAISGDPSVEMSDMGEGSVEDPLGNSGSLGSEDS